MDCTVILVALIIGFSSAICMAAPSPAAAAAAAPAPAPAAAAAPAPSPAAAPAPSPAYVSNHGYTNGTTTDPAARKVLMEYIGASGKAMKFDMPINEGLDVYYILGFAVDASTNGSYNNGRFVPAWDVEGLTPEAVAAVKAAHPNVRVMMSLCGWSLFNDSGLDQPLFWYEPLDPAAWLDNAFASISALVHQYHLDGIDVDYENFHYPNNFSSIIGELLTTLKAENVAPIITIAPFNHVVKPYIELYQTYNASIDYVLYQFYADAVPNATAYLRSYNNVAKVFGYKKLVPSYEVNGRGVQGQAWWDSLALIHQQNPIPGVMIWSADESAPLHYPYEIQAQALLTNGTYSN